MSTSATIPVFDPQGVLRDIPEDQLQLAVKSGGKPAVKFQAPDNSIRYVPADRTHEAVQAGGKLLPFEQQEVQHPGFWHSLASDLTGMVKGLAAPDPLADPRVSDEEKSTLVAQQQAAANAKNAERTKEHGAGYSWTASAGEMLGIPVSGMEQSAQEGDVGGVMGHAATVPVVMAGAKGLGKAGSLAESVARKVTPKQVAQAVGGASGAGLGQGALSIPGAYYGVKGAGSLAEGILGKEYANKPIGLPSRVEGGPAIAPKYTSQAIKELGPKAPIQSIRARAAEIQQAANEAVGYKPPEPGKPIAQRPANMPTAASRAASDAAFQKNYPAETMPEGMTPQEKEIWQEKVFGEKPAGDIGAKVRNQNPEPTRAEVKAAQIPEGHTAVESSAMKSYKYDPQAQEFEVTTPGGQHYVYGDVSPDQASAFEAAESKGKAWNELRQNSTLVAKVVKGKRIPVPRTMNEMDKIPEDEWQAGHELETGVEGTPRR